MVLILCMMGMKQVEQAEKVKGIAEKLGMSARVVKLRDNVDPGGLTKTRNRKINGEVNG